MNPRYFEDYTVGEVVNADGFTLTEAEIIHFALTYDPQPFHMDVQKAKESIYGGLIASGWQGALIGFRMLLNAGLLGEGSLGSPGIDQVRWLKPVRPGDTLYAHAKVVDKRVSQSKPERGVVHLDWWIDNQTGETVTTMKSIQLVRRRSM